MSMDVGKLKAFFFKNDMSLKPLQALNISISKVPIFAATDPKPDKPTVAPPNIGGGQSSHQIMFIFDLLILSL